MPLISKKKPKKIIHRKIQIKKLKKNTQNLWINIQKQQKNTKRPKVKKTKKFLKKIFKIFFSREKYFIFTKILVRKKDI